MDEFKLIMLAIGTLCLTSTAIGLLIERQFNKLNATIVRLSDHTIRISERLLSIDASAITIQKAFTSIALTRITHAETYRNQGEKLQATLDQAEVDRIARDERNRLNDQEWREREHKDYGIWRNRADIQIDKEISSNVLWRKAINQRLSDFQVALRVLRPPKKAKAKVATKRARR